MGKGWQFFGGGSEFLETLIIIFTSRLLFGLLFACRLRDVAEFVILQ